MDAGFRSEKSTNGRFLVGLAERRSQPPLSRGTELLIRPIRPSDADALQAGFERLSPMSRYYRFHTGMRRIPDALLHRLTHVDGESHVALVALERADGRPPEGVGVARFVRLASDPKSAEVAAVVLEHAQGRGIARRLLAELALLARERGVETFSLTVLAANARVRRLLADLGANAVGSEGSVIQYELPVIELLRSAARGWVRKAREVA